MIPIEPDVPATRRWRRSLDAAFLVIGLCFASWVTRTPDIRDAVQASTAEMGLVLAGLSVGSLIGITTAGRLVARLGARPVIAAALGAMVTGLAVIALGTAAGSAVLVGTGLGLFGLGMGSSEVAANVEGSAIENITGRSVLPWLHGCFSIGTFAGAVVGIGSGLLRTPVTAHLVVVALVMALVAWWVVPGIPVRSRPPQAEPGQVAPAPGPLWRDRTIVLIGVVVLGMAFAEGTANDWLPLIAVDGFAASGIVGSSAYAVFALTMAIGRFCGPRVLERFGRVAAIRGTAFLAAAGILVVIVAPNIGVGAVGIVLWGLGASLGFPVALSAAGDDPEHSAARVSIVATIGYLAFLVGPPLIGLLGEAVTLRDAIAAVMAMVLLAGVCAPAARGRAAAEDTEGTASIS